jgi:ribonuclease G
MAESGPSYTIAVSRSPGERRAALLENGAVIEIVHRRDAEIQPGAVYAGRVGARVPGVDAVFVAIDSGPPGVLKTKSPPPEGAAVMVAVVVPPRPGKGPELKSVADARAAEAPDPVVTWWERYASQIRSIVCDSQREATRLKELLGAAPMEIQDGGDLFGELGIDEAIEMALRPHVVLPGGGSVVIETTAAVTAIDINSGASDPAAANHAAMSVIAREVRTRNLAGHFVVDVIPGKGNGALPRLLTKALAADTVLARVAGTTPLGMIEFTRQRLGLSLTEQLLDENGALSVASIAYACLRQGVREALRGKAASLSITAVPDVIGLLQGPLRAALSEAADQMKTDIKLVADPSFPRAKFVCKTS